MQMSGSSSSTLRSNASGSSTAPTTSRPASVSSRTMPSRSSTESSAITTRMAPPRRSSCRRPTGLTSWKVPSTARTRSRRPVRPLPARLGGAAVAVVDDRDLQPVPAGGVAAQLDVHRRLLGAGVPGHVGQRLGHHEVGDGLRGRAGAPFEPDVEPHRDRGARGQRGQRGVQAAVGQHGRVDATDHVAQLGDRVLRLLVRAGDQLPGGLRVGVELLLGHPEVHRQRDQVLLRAVVQVALDPAALGVRRVDHPGPRLGQRGHLRGQHLGPARRQQRADQRELGVRQRHGQHRRELQRQQADAEAGQHLEPRRPVQPGHDLAARQREPVGGQQDAGQRRSPRPPRPGRRTGCRSGASAGSTRSPSTTRARRSAPRRGARRSRPPGPAAAGRATTTPRNIVARPRSKAAIPRAT